MNYWYSVRVFIVFNHLHVYFKFHETVKATKIFKTFDKVNLLVCLNRSFNENGVRSINLNPYDRIKAASQIVLAYIKPLG